MRICLISTVRSLALTLTALALVLLAPAASAQTAPTFAKSFAPSTIGPGSVSTLTFTITNGGSTPVRNLAFSDTFPAGMVVATPASASTDCAGGVISAAAGGGNVSLLDGGIGTGVSCTVTVNVTSSTPGTHTNVSGDLTSDAGNSGSATADLTVATDRPGFSKSFSPSSIFFGGRSTLVFTFDNTANTSNAISMRFVDDLPNNLTIASPANANTTCNGGTITAPPGGSTISYAPAIFTDASVDAGATCTLEVDVVGGAIGTLINVSDDLTSLGPFGGLTRSSGKATAALSVAIEKISLEK